MNPLAKYFRQPAVHLTLPSKGQFWPVGSLDLNMSGQLEVYPMTTRDEITLRTPDALLNGESMISLFQSCCPQIKDAWKMPSIDVDAVLIAIRIASYGTEMDIDSICVNKECKAENKHALDLTLVLDSIQAPNFNKTIDIQNLKIKLKPATYFENNKNNMLKFEQERAIAVISDDSLSDEQKVTMFQEHLNKMIDINAEMLISAIEYIETSEGFQVVDLEHIKDFFENCDTKIMKSVRDRFEDYSKSMELMQPKVRCEECNTEYPIELKFDYTSFFAAAS
jgi:hypothetical protein